jgi:hypothetical protein
VPPKGKMSGKKGGKEPIQIKKYDYRAFQPSNPSNPSNPSKSTVWLAVAPNACRLTTVSSRVFPPCQETT